MTVKEVDAALSDKLVATLALRNPATTDARSLSRHHMPARRVRLPEPAISTFRLREYCMHSTEDAASQTDGRHQDH
jgi:hypothetical protein